MVSSPQARKLARDRKQRQRLRAKEAGLAVLQCKAPATLLKKAKLAAMLHPQQSMDAVMLDALEGYFERTHPARAKILSVALLHWPKIREYLPNAAALIRPCEPIKYKGLTFTFDEWAKLAPIDAALRAEFAKYGIQDYRTALDGIILASKQGLVG